MPALTPLQPTQSASLTTTRGVEPGGDSSTEVTEAVSTVTTAVTAAVVVAVASSVAGAAAGAVAGASAGGSAGGAGGSAGGGGGIALPLVLGAQRAGLSGGLAVRKSDIDAGVSDSFGWASGDLGLFTTPVPPPPPPAVSASSVNGRSLSKDNTTSSMDKTTSVPEATWNGPSLVYNGLIEKLNLFGIFGMSVAALQLLVALWWKFGINRHFYLEQSGAKWDAGSLPTGRKGLVRSKSGKQAQTRSGTKYCAFPGIFVFPNVLLVACKLFVTGLMDSATNLSMNMSPNEACEATTCKLVSVITLSGALLYALLGWFVMIDYAWRFRASSWKANPRPETPNEAKDPIFRLLNSARRRFGCRRTRVVTDRALGKFAKPQEDLREPERTERLLRQLFFLRRRRCADMLDAYQFAFFPRSNGVRAINICFDHGGMTVQLVIAVLCGVGKNIDKGTVLATVQVATTCTLQFLYALFCLLWWPSCDKADAWMTGMQFLVEGSRTGLLLLQLPIPDAAFELQEVSYNLSLVAICVPLVRFFYDAVVVQLITLHKGDKLNARAAGVSMMMFLAQLSELIMKGVGFEGHTTEVKTSCKAAIEAAKASKKVADQQIVVDLAEMVANIPVDLGLQTFIWDDVRPRQEQAAKTIQQMSRQRQKTRMRALLSSAMVQATPPIPGSTPRADLEWLIQAEVRAASARARGVRTGE